MSVADDDVPRKNQAQSKTKVERAEAEVTAVVVSATKVLVSMGNDPDTATDAVHEVLPAVLEKWDTIEHHQPYLVRSARRELARRQKEERRYEFQHVSHGDWLEEPQRQSRSPSAGGVNLKEGSL